MKKSRLTFAAGGGLLDRRSFLQSGVRFSVAGALAGVATTAAGVAPTEPVGSPR